MSLLTATVIADRNPADVFAAAELAAKEAAASANAKLPSEDKRGLDCGFASVIVRPATGPFINWCRKNQKGSKNWNGGWRFSASGYCNTQSISVHEAAARAFRDVLVANGTLADVESRYD